jgi:DNA-binding GntR family transcriptional regulator
MNELYDLENNQSEKKPLATRAYEILHEKIITMELRPGHSIDEKETIESIGIGRTPVREALLRLASEDLLQFIPNKGFIVKPLTLQDVKAMFEALRVIENGAATIAVSKNNTSVLPQMEKYHEMVKEAIKKRDLLRLVKANHNFHIYFAHCTQNEYLVRALNDVRNHLNRLAYLSFGGVVDLSGDLQKHYESVCQEHEQIIELLRLKKLNSLLKVIERHINSFQQRIVDYLTS